VSILDNLEYTGVAVMQKIGRKSYKDKKPFTRPEEEWVIHENAHEAIISKETFETAKRLRQGRRRQSKTGDLGVLNGLIFCEDCGGKLHLKRARKTGKDGVQIEYCYYECRNSRVCRREFATCTTHSMRKEYIEELALKDLQCIMGFAKNNEEEFIVKVTASEGKERQRTLRKAETELSKSRHRVLELDRIINRIYEDNISGKISDERFQTMLQNYETEQSSLKTLVAELEITLRQANHQTESADKFLRLVRNYTEPTELSGELVREFIEKIVVGKPEYLGQGRRYKKQRVKITYSYIGEQFNELLEVTKE